MTLPRLITTEAIILRSVSIGEADRVLTLFTPTWGKLQATARGVRKTTSKLGGHLDVLTRSTLTLGRGMSMETVTSAETLETFATLKESLASISHAIYLAELADALNPLESPNEPAYRMLAEALRALDAGQDAGLVLRAFEVRSLALAGFALQLDLCVECHDALRPGAHLLSPAAGGMLCPSCAPAHKDAMPLSVDALKVLRYLSVNSLAAALRINVGPALQRELAALMANILRSVLERELRSSAFLRSVGAPDPSAATGNR